MQSSTESGWKWNTPSNNLRMSSGDASSRSTQRKRLVSAKRVGIRNKSMSREWSRPAVVKANERIISVDCKATVSEAGGKAGKQGL